MAVYYTGEWLEQATRLLDASGVPSARLDALILLEDATKKDRAYLLAHPEHPVHSSALYGLNKLLERRASHEPLAYIRGKSEFYGRTFMVDHATLQPRPETEAMIVLLRTLTLPKQPRIIDIGTGSGILAITAKLELPNARVVATDISPAALVVAQKNAKLLKAAVTFHQGDLLAAVPAPLFKMPCSLLLANLPYVPDSYVVNEAARHEPVSALFGGQDGLDLYRQLFGQLSTHRATYVMTESLENQHQVLAAIARQVHYHQIAVLGLVQLFSLERQLQV
jgi:release factor glutamine methyltransferase